MGNDLISTVLNQVIGAIIGTIVSFVVSWYFYKKADFPSRTSAEMTESMLAMVIEDRLEAEFSSFQPTPSEQLPADKDIPHINGFWCSSIMVPQGKSAAILARVEDTGFDFLGSDDLEVTDTSSGTRFPVTRQGHGFYSCKIYFPENAVLGEHEITFRLTDGKRRSFTQSLRLNVVGRA